jgi:hypothetical protein
MVQVLQEADLAPFMLGNAWCVEGIGFVASGDAQIVVWHFERDAFKCVLAKDRLLLQI